MTLLGGGLSEREREINAKIFLGSFSIFVTFQKGIKLGRKAFAIKHVSRLNKENLWL